MIPSQDAAPERDPFNNDALERIVRSNDAEYQRMHGHYVGPLAQRLLEARLLAKNLFQMIDRETWRATGGDDGQGHYEGDYRAAGIEEEIASWQ